MATKVVGSVELRTNAAFEAMKRFEGPANGIKLNPKEVSITSISSTMEDIARFPFPIVVENVSLNL